MANLALVSDADALFVHTVDDDRPDRAATGAGAEDGAESFFHILYAYARYVENNKKIVDTK